MLNVCDDCTGNAFRNQDHYDFDNRYCPSSEGIFAVHTPIIADRPSTDSGLDEATWLTRWHIDHTPVAIATQSTFGYTQNAVVRPLTPEAPLIAAIVEELFPEEAISDLHAFFGAADDNDLRDRMERMVASTAAFGANRDVDTVPTSRYVFRTPFAVNHPRRTVIP